MSMRTSDANQYRARRRENFQGAGCAVAIAAVVLALVVGISAIFHNYNHISTRVLTVCSKERVATQNGGEYRIYTSGGTFVMKDSLFGKTRFNTADAYGKIQPETTYSVQIKGWRVPLFSSFKNILSFNKLPASQQTPRLCDNG